MRRILAIVFATALGLGGAVAPAVGAFKFGPHANACQGPSNQPNCPGSH